MAKGKPASLRWRCCEWIVAILRVCRVASVIRQHPVCSLQPRNAGSLLQTCVSDEAYQEVAVLGAGGVSGFEGCVSGSIYIGGRKTAGGTKLLAAELESLCRALRGEWAGGRSGVDEGS